MFWGLILKANKKYTQLLEKPFHLTKASLDHSTTDDEPIQVMYSDGESTFLLCTLQKGKELQCSLDLNFAEGDTVCFSTKGTGIVHLTGYMMPEDDFGDMDMDEEDESVDESEPEEAQADLRELLQKKKKEKEKAGKKDKKKAPVVAEDSSDEDAEESDDEDVLNGSSTLNTSALSSSLGDSDDDEDDDDDLSDDEEVSDSDEEEEEIAPPKPKQLKLDPKQKNQKQNGVEKNGQDKKDKKDKKKEKPQPAQPEKKEKEQTKKENKQPQVDNKIQKLQGGLTFQDLKPGTGAEAKPGKKVQVYYEGRLKSNNKMFDSTKSGAGFKFTLGRGEVIKAWDIGIAGMKVGGKRRVTCPPGLAYGAKGNPPVIPGNSTLVFDVELKNVL